MSKFYISIVFYLFVFAEDALAQNILGEVKYLEYGGFKNVADTATLLYGRQESLYYKLRSPKGLAEEKVTYSPTLKRTFTKEGVCFYTDFSSKSQVARQNIKLKFYLIKEALEKPEWKIQKEFKKNITGYSCQKATTFFKGRNFVAWFANDIHISRGPWKLWGLPGLILEAYSEDKELSFETISLKLSPNTTQKIAPPTDGTPKSRVLFKKEEKQEAKKMQLALEAAIGDKDTKIIPAFSGYEK